MSHAQGWTYGAWPKWSNSECPNGFWLGFNTILEFGLGLTQPLPNLACKVRITPAYELILWTYLIKCGTLSNSQYLQSSKGCGDLLTLLIQENSWDTSLKYPKVYNKKFHDGKGGILLTLSFLSWWPNTTNFAMSRDMTYPGPCAHGGYVSCGHS